MSNRTHNRPRPRPRTNEASVVAVVKRETPPIARTVAHDVVSERDAERQRKEDTRANHRNFNRMLTLIWAWVLTIAVTWSLQPQHHIVSKQMAKTWGPYTFTIVVMLDSALAIYGMIRKY